jgi:hypothetical protein
LNSLKNQFGDRVDVPEDRQFVGFDGYRKATDCLKPGDIVISATPPAFRWAHFDDAVKKGLHVFMEKPLTADGPTSRRMLAAAEQAKAKNLKVGVGLMSRHSRALQELHQRIQDGEIGDIVSMRGYRMGGPIGSVFSERWPGQPSELLWQIQRFHSFLWASGGGFSDFNIHIIDHLCWMKNAWPVKAQAVGGRHFRGDYVDQNFDSYSVEYIFEDGSRLHMDGRCMHGAHSIYNSYVHGAKAARSPRMRATAACRPAPSRARIPTGLNNCGNPRFRRTSAIRTKTNGMPGGCHPRRRTVQRGRKRHLCQPGDLDGTQSGPYGPRDHPASDAGRRARICTRAGPVDDGFTTAPESDEQGRYPIPQPGLLGDREF